MLAVPDCIGPLCPKNSSPSSFHKSRTGVSVPLAWPAGRLPFFLEELGTFALSKFAN